MARRVQMKEEAPKKEALDPLFGGDDGYDPAYDTDLDGDIDGGLGLDPLDMDIDPLADDGLGIDGFAEEGEDLEYPAPPEGYDYIEPDTIEENDGFDDLGEVPSYDPLTAMGSDPLVDPILEDDDFDDDDLFDDDDADDPIDGSTVFGESAKKIERVVVPTGFRLPWRIEGASKVEIHKGDIITIVGSNTGRPSFAESLVDSVANRLIEKAGDGTVDGESSDMVIVGRRAVVETKYNFLIPGTDIVLNEGEVFIVTSRNAMIEAEDEKDDKKADDKGAEDNFGGKKAAPFKKGNDAGGDGDGKDDEGDKERSDKGDKKDDKGADDKEDDKKADKEEKCKKESFQSHKRAGLESSRRW